MATPGILSPWSCCLRSPARERAAFEQPRPPPLRFGGGGGRECSSAWCESARRANPLHLHAGTIGRCVSGGTLLPLGVSPPHLRNDRRPLSGALPGELTNPAALSLRRPLFEKLLYLTAARLLPGQPHDDGTQSFTIRAVRAAGAGRASVSVGGIDLPRRRGVQLGGDHPAYRRRRLHLGLEQHLRGAARPGVGVRLGRALRPLGDSEVQENKSISPRAAVLARSTRTSGVVGDQLRCGALGASDCGPTLAVGADQGDEVGPEVDVVRLEG